MNESGLGKLYSAGDVIIAQGDIGDAMYVIQEGKVEVIYHNGERETRLAVRGKGEFFGEMALFERERRMATVRALGPARVLSVDKRNLFRHIQQDPTLAFRIIEVMSQRIRELSAQVGGGLQEFPAPPG